MTKKQTKHVLGISGGKDSAALAIYLRERIPEMEYYFCDTRKELPETYDFLVRLEAYLGKPIVRLNSKTGFDHWLKVFNGYLPSSRTRWCTRNLKLRPFEEWVGDDPVISYVAIRADEDRMGYVSTKTNIEPVFPFMKEGVIKEDVFCILDESGVGIPEYYKWRTRSGCYFCFFQRKIEWIGLKEHHPDLFEKAKKYEKIGLDDKVKFTWAENESLDEIIRPERIAEIRRKHQLAMEKQKSYKSNRRLVDIFEQIVDEELDDDPCLVCTL